MGKRKYENKHEESMKKSKTENNENAVSEQPQNEHENKSKQRMATNDGFDVKYFRKELSLKQGQSLALTQFLQVCLNPDSDRDYMLEYLNIGGNSHEILRQIGQENKKNLTLATPAFHLFYLIILKVQSSLPHAISITEEACRYFLNTFMSTVEIMISENSGPRHRKIILKLFTSMVTLNPDLGIEILNQAPLTPKHLQYILDKVNYKEKDNVRTAFVHFMTSFLVDGHLLLIKALLEKQGLLALVIPGMVEDEADAVMMFLSILKKNIIDNPLISKSLKLKTFSHQVLHNIFKIYTWKGPPELNHEMRNEVKPEILELLSKIILTLFTSHKLGLYFVDITLGTTDANKNQNLYKALLTLKRPWENESQCEVILEIVCRCPDLHRALINVIEQSFEPQHSPIWERTVAFVIKLINKLKPEDMVLKMTSLSPLQVANFIRFTTLPVPILKFIHTSLGKDDLTVAVYSVKVLVKMLATLKRYLQILEMNNCRINILELKNRLESFFPKHLPVPSTVVSLIEIELKGVQDTDKSQDYKLPKPEDADSLILLMDLLLLYHDLHPAFFEGLEGSLDMKNILDYSKSLSTGNIALLKFKIVSLWLTLDNSAISLKNPMFKELFLIMLEVYTNDDGDTWIEAKETMKKFFKNTSIYETDEDEVHIMLYTLRNAKVNPISNIADIIEYVLSNKKELTEYVRNQIVHFEITDENSQTSLDKLFNDLMEDRSTEDSTFIENKVPSPFIVGCIQYIQTNKDLKKSLKHFLSLYIANLLHFNYSPELTEVLIGDSKLDVRSYVASWIGEPIALSEAIADNTSTLRKITMSIVGCEEIVIQDIFPFIEIASVEDPNIVVMEIPLKITPNVVIDSSDLLIWIKYLTFCLIRLTQMGRLLEMQQKKIFHYFGVIMEISKKCHMSDVCHTILRNLLVNPHILHIYSAIDQNKDEAKILATNFLLDVIVQHSEIVHNFRTNNILQPFQQKNYNELIKTFIKMRKKKNINTGHTIKVLEVIGMSIEDDLNALKHIFELDVSILVKDDKEPSIALEVLRVLIMKYSKLINEDLPENHLKNIMKLYVDLLACCRVNPNISELETTLAVYFEMKPHQTKIVSADNFKQFFHTHVIRKSTTQLASTILTYNDKFCDIFKEELSNPEILGQRELTLPLGNALIHHNKFILSNKDLLHRIWGEYRSNILKLLEKPNKAGQIYIFSWRFIRKLLFECAEINDCERIFGKLHKYEIVEVTHCHLLHALFLKLLLFTDAHKKDYLINYFLAMLNLTTNGIKEGKEEVHINDIVSNIYTGAQIAKDIKGFEVKQKNDFQKLTETTIWQNFCKSVLKESLKVKTTSDGVNNSGPKLLSLLTTLVKLFYPFNHEDIVMLFDMVTSHSEFLNVMLSHHSSDIKSRLIEFIYVLILRNKTVMKGQQIPVFLSAYHATRSPCDRLILTVLHFYEAHGQPVHEYKPYVWGDSAANYYSVRKSRTSTLWGHPTPNQILNLFEKDTVGKTVEKFPVTQKLDYHYELLPNIRVTDEDISADGNIKTLLNKMSKDGLLEVVLVKDNETAIRGITLKTKYDKIILKLRDTDLTTFSHEGGCLDETIYDPAFLFPLLSHLLAPGSMASCFKVLRSGLLSIPVMALSSYCPSMRAAAYHILHRFCLLLDTETKHKNDKLLLTHFIDTLRQSLSTAIITTQKEKDAIKDFNNPRLPAVDALYLARSLMVYTAPFDPLYKPVNNFLMAKQQVDLTVVPDFLSLFHDSNVEATERRLWILNIIRDGMKTMSDVVVVFKTMCLKMIMDFYCSVLSDRKVKERILGVLSSIASIPRAAEILVEGYGLMSWLSFVVRDLNRDEKSLIKSILILLGNLLYSISVNSFSKAIGFGKNNSNNGKSIEDFGELKVNKDVEQEVLMMLIDLELFMIGLEFDDVSLYVRTYNLLSKRTIKLLNKKQLIRLINSVSVNNHLKNILVKAILTNNSDVLKSKCIVNSIDDNIDVKKKTLGSELIAVVAKYIL